MFHKITQFLFPIVMSVNIIKLFSLNYAHIMLDCDNCTSSAIALLCMYFVISSFNKLGIGIATFCKLRSWDLIRVEVMQ